MAKRLITGLIGTLISSGAFSSEDHVKRYLSDEYAEVKIERISSGELTECLGKIISPKITLKKSISRLFYQDICSIDGQSIKRKAWYLVEGYSEMLVLKNGALKGSVVSAGMVEQRLVRDLGGAVRLEDYPNGVRLKLDLHEGAVLTVDNVVPADWKLPGEVVKVVSSVGSASISTQGVLVETGRIGGFLKVKIKQRLVEGWMRQDGVVYVE